MANFPSACCPRFQVRIQQAVEQVLAGLAAGGEAARRVGAGGEAALDGLAYREVLFLDLFAGGDACEIPIAGGLGNVGEVEVENHFGFVYAARDDDVRVQGVWIAIDHQVRVNPVVESPVPAALSGSRPDPGAKDL